jgi:hypothetical protein
MIRTQIQLEERDYEELRTMASEARRSIADCIREGIQLFLRTRRLKASVIDEIAGKFRPLPPADLKDHDRWFADAVEASRKSERPQ